LQPRLVVLEGTAGLLRPFYRVLSFLDPLFGSAATIVKLDHILRVLGQVGHNEADTREQLAHVPLRPWRPRDVADAKISPDIGSCDKTPAACAKGVPRDVWAAARFPVPSRRIG